MAGRCHAETSAQTWGTTPSYLWRQGVLTDDELRARAQTLVKSGDGTYLLELLERGR